VAGGVEFSTWSLEFPRQCSLTWKIQFAARFSSRFSFSLHPTLLSSWVPRFQIKRNAIWYFTRCICQSPGLFFRWKTEKHFIGLVFPRKHFPAPTRVPTFWPWKAQSRLQLKSSSPPAGKPIFSENKRAELLKLLQLDSRGEMLEIKMHSKEVSFHYSWV